MFYTLVNWNGIVDVAPLSLPTIFNVACKIVPATALVGKIAFTVVPLIFNEVPITVLDTVVPVVIVAVFNA